MKPPPDEHQPCAGHQFGAPARWRRPRPHGVHTGQRGPGSRRARAPVAITTASDTSRPPPSSRTARAAVVQPDRGAPEPPVHLERVVRAGEQVQLRALRVPAR